MNRFLKLLNKDESKSEKKPNKGPLIIRVEPNETIKILISTTNTNLKSKSELYDFNAIRKMVNNDSKLKEMSNELSKMFNKNIESNKLNDILI